MLYKYVVSERIDVIEHLKIRLTPYNELNDPFECRFVLNPIKSEIEKAKDDNSQAEQTQVEVWGQTHIAQLGMLCLSRTPRNLLMWSHYAQNHKGFVIGFDEHHSFFSRETYYIETTYRLKKVLNLPGFGTLRDVVYSQERPTINLGDNIPFDSFFRKSIDWSYEQEVRMFLTLRDGEETAIKDKDGKPTGKTMFLFNIPADAIRQIIIGIENGWEEKLLDLVKQEKFKHIEIYKAYLHHKNFSLEFQKIYDPN